MFTPHRKGCTQKKVEILAFWLTARKNRRLRLAKAPALGGLVLVLCVRSSCDIPARAQECVLLNLALIHGMRPSSKAFRLILRNEKGQPYLLQTVSSHSWWNSLCFIYGKSCQESIMISTEGYADGSPPRSQSLYVSVCKEKPPFRCPQVVASTSNVFICLRCLPGSNKHTLTRTDTTSQKGHQNDHSTAQSLQSSGR